jgi:hypothetical protein
MRTFLGVFLLLMLGAPTLFGALGEPESSVGADQQILRGQVREEVRQGYRLHQITEANGAIVREYVSPAGKVFGVSWQGPYVPMMKQLLGSYFTYLQQYAQAQTGRRGGPLVIQKDNFVFTSSGHMRSYRGRAYVPSLLPTNLSPEVVQ